MNTMTRHNENHLITFVLLFFTALTFPACTPAPEDANWDALISTQELCTERLSEKGEYLVETIDFQTRHYAVGTVREYVGVLKALRDVGAGETNARDEAEGDLVASAIQRIERLREMYEMYLTGQMDDLGMTAEETATRSKWLGTELGSLRDNLMGMPEDWPTAMRRSYANLQVMLATDLTVTDLGSIFTVRDLRFSRYYPAVLGAPQPVGGGDSLRVQVGAVLGWHDVGNDDVSFGYDGRRFTPDSAGMIELIVPKNRIDLSIFFKDPLTGTPDTGTVLLDFSDW